MSCVPTLLKQTDRPLATVLADGAYDVRSVYEAVDQHTDWIDTRVLIRKIQNAERSGSQRTMSHGDQNTRDRDELGDRE